MRWRDAKRLAFRNTSIRKYVTLVKRPVFEIKNLQIKSQIFFIEINVKILAELSHQPVKMLKMLN